MCCDFEMSRTWNDPVKVATQGTSKSQSASVQKEKGKGLRGPVTPKLPKFETYEEKADFMINEFKVKLCTRRRRHTWSGCPHAHRGETARRRNPNTYHAVPCPEMKQGNRCPRGDRCCYSHHDFEYWLHPARYCTVMCNKGTKCDRSLCFFAHTPEELRTCPMNRDGSGNNDNMMVDQLSESSSSGRNNCEKTGPSEDELKSCGSYTSLTESFRTLQGKSDDLKQASESSIVKRPGQESLQAILSSSNSLTMAFSRPEVSSARKENIAPSGVTDYSTATCTASSDICQLLNQTYSNLGILDFGRTNPEGNEEVLRKSFLSNSASHLSPTCHFSGISQEFARQSLPPATPACSVGYEVTNGDFQGHNDSRFDWMQQDSCPMQRQDCCVVDLKQLEMLNTVPMTSAAQVLDHNRGHDQAMDYFGNLSHNVSPHAAALTSLASSTALYGAPSRQDLLGNVDNLQLLRLHLLCNTQGGLQQTPSSSLFSPSLFNPQFSLEEVVSRDALYSLQEEKSVINHALYPNLLQRNAVNNDAHF